jgi:hypothetical protein
VQPGGLIDARAVEELPALDQERSTAERLHRRFAKPAR